jgi:hypothetical protein
MTTRGRLSIFQPKGSAREPSNTDYLVSLPLQRHRNRYSSLCDETTVFMDVTPFKLVYTDAAKEDVSFEANSRFILPVHQITLDTSWKRIISRGTASPILDLGSRWKQHIKFAFRSLYSRSENPGCLFERRIAGSRAGVDVVANRKFLVTATFRILPTSLSIPVHLIRLETH